MIYTFEIIFYTNEVSDTKLKGHHEQNPATYTDHQLTLYMLGLSRLCTLALYHVRTQLLYMSFLKLWIRVLIEMNQD